MKRAITVIVAAVAALAAILSFGVIALIGGATNEGVTLQADAACTVVAGEMAPSGTYDSVQMTNAATIVLIGRQNGVNTHGQEIAIATAIQESGLRNLASRAMPASLTFPNDGVAPGDHQSVGIMQQQPWWWPDGMQDGMSVAYQARQFYGGQDRVPSIRGLLDIPGWESMPLWQAAQAVQRSAFPTAYQKHAEDARAIVAAVSANVPLSTGVSAADCDPTGEGLAAFANLPGATIGERVVNVAAAEIAKGIPYSWGGGGLTGPSTGVCKGSDCYALTRVGYDCSGLTRMSWYTGSGGLVTLPRVAADQYRATVRVPVDQLQAGDTLYFNNLGHTGIYDGRGGMLHTYRKDKPAEYVPNFMDGYWGTRFYGAGRPVLPAS